MNKMENMKDILEKSLEIGINNKFNVRIIDSNDYNPFIDKEMTYIELGQYLIANNKDIDYIEINIIK